MKTIMLDSNVVIDYSRHNTEALKRLSEYDGYLLAISFFVYVEVMAGTHPKYKIKTEKALRYFDILSFGIKPQTEGRIFARRYHAGKPMDLLIAAHAKAEGVPLLTNNIKDFAKFKGLKTIHYKLPY